MSEKQIDWVLVEETLTKVSQALNQQYHSNPTSTMQRLDTTPPPCRCTATTPIPSEGPAASKQVEPTNTVSTAQGTYQVAPMLHHMPPTLRYIPPMHDDINNGILERINIYPQHLPCQMPPPPFTGPLVPYRKTGRIIRGGIHWSVSKDGTALLNHPVDNPRQQSRMHWPAHQHPPKIPYLTQANQTDLAELMHVVGGARTASMASGLRQESGLYRTRLRELNTWSTDRAGRIMPDPNITPVTINISIHMEASTPPYHHAGSSNQRDRRQEARQPPRRSKKKKKKTKPAEPADKIQGSARTLNVLLHLVAPKAIGMVLALLGRPRAAFVFFLAASATATASVNLTRDESQAPRPTLA